MTLKMNLEGKLLQILTTFPEKYFLFIFTIQQLSAKKSWPLQAWILFTASDEY